MVTDPKKIGQVLLRLKSMAARLNGRAEQANVRIAEMNAKLAEMNVGVEAWAPGRIRSEEGDLCLGYARVDGEWTLAVSEDSSDSVPRSLAKAGRLARIGAAERLADVLEALMQEVDALLAHTKDEG